MDVLHELMRKPQQTESLAIGVFVVTVLYTIYRQTTYTILVGIAFTMIVLGALPRQVALAFLVGASAILLVQTSSERVERFTSGSGEEEEEPFASGPEEEEEEFASGSGSGSGTGEEEDLYERFVSGSGEEEEVKVPVKAKAPKKDQGKTEAKEEAFADRPKKRLLPDNTDRKEMLELGKEYKLPNEKDDEGYHLDAGTTFLNAYKALKPDQIAAMTKDTQELLATQKSLIGMLDSFGPLMKDMGKITGFFGSG